MTPPRAARPLRNPTPAPVSFTLADAMVKDIVPSGRAIMRAERNHGRPLLLGRRTEAVVELEC